VRLDGVAGAGGGAERPAEEDVVREDEVGASALTQGRRVRLDPGVELCAGAVLEELHVVARVVVEDEDG
jgi:hypothetical protein